MASAGSNADRWILTVPTGPMTTLSDEDYLMATRLRLGLPPIDLCPSKCSNHNCNQKPIQPSSHYLTCKHTKGTSTIFRHNEILSTFAYYTKLVGLHPQVEPAGLDPDSRSRPDLAFFYSNQLHLFDVTIIHPTTESNNTFFHTKDNPPVEKASQNKEKKYRGLNLDVKGIAFDTFGASSKSADALIKQLSNIAADNLLFLTPGDVNELLRNSIAIQIQRNNSHLIRAGLDAYVHGWRSSLYPISQSLDFPTHHILSNHSQ